MPVTIDNKGDSPVRADPAQVAEFLLTMARDNYSEEMRRVFRSHRSLRLKNRDIALYCAERLIKLNEPDEAERLLDDSLTDGETGFALLELLGRLDELRGEMVSAFDTYRRAALVAKKGSERKKIEAALARVKRYTYCETAIDGERFTLTLEGNRRPLRLQFRTAQMEKRSAIMKALVRSTAADAASAIEIECDGGLVSRALHSLGLSVESTAEEMPDLLLALGFEYAEMLKSGSYSCPEYHRLRAEDVAAGAVRGADLVLLLPPRMEWYRRRGPGAAARLIADLFQVCGRQLFFYLPLAGKGGKDGALAWEIMSALCRSEKLKHAPGPVLVYSGADGDLLYRIDRTSASPHTHTLAPAPGPAAAGPLFQVSRPDRICGRSSILLVERERLVSEGGFGYSDGGFNPFRGHLSEMLAAPDTPYRHSVLNLFYDSFKPQNRQEQLFGLGASALPPLDRGWTLLPWEETAGRHPNPLTPPLHPGGGYLYHGPNHDLFGAMISKKLLLAYSRLSLNGYRPEIYPDGYIQGYLLKDGDDYRFVVNEGFHRATAASLLDYPELTVKFNPRSARVVDVAELSDWPGVKRGLYSTGTAEKVFRRYLGQSGSIL